MLFWIFSDSSNKKQKNNNNKKQKPDAYIRRHIFAWRGLYTCTSDYLIDIVLNIRWAALAIVFTLNIRTPDLPSLSFLSCGLNNKSLKACLWKITKIVDLILLTLHIQQCSVRNCIPSLPPHPPTHRLPSSTGLSGIRFSKLSGWAQWSQRK